MEVRFANSFFKSLSKLAMYNTWWYKTYEVFRYGIPGFFRNIWTFRKELYRFRDFDFHYNAALFRRSLEELVHAIEHYGHEIEETRMKKVAKMKRAIEILKNFEEDNFIDQAEKSVGTEVFLEPFEFESVTENGKTFSRMKHTETPEQAATNRKIYETARQIENDQWFELWDILKGQDYSKFVSTKTDWEEREKEYNDWYDGSDGRAWWD